MMSLGADLLALKIMSPLLLLAMGSQMCFLSYEIVRYIG
jgi:hypothetical protein